MVCSLRLSLLKQGLSEPEFYGDLMYKFRKYLCINLENILGGDFSDQLKKMSFVIKELDTAYMSCDRVHAMLMRQGIPNHD